MIAPAVTNAAPVASAYLAALIDGDRHRAIAVLTDAFDEGCPLLVLYADVIEWAQHEIGRGWAAGTISVAEEHVATAISQYALNVLYHRAPAPMSGAGLLAVIGGVRGEMHSLGPHLIADAFEAQGWSVRYLGSDVPDGDIVQIVEDLRPALVGLSATMSENLDVVQGLIRDLRWNGYRDPVLVGGAAFTGADTDAWRRVGADVLCTDVRAAAAQAALVATQRSQPTDYSSESCSSGTIGFARRSAMPTSRLIALTASLISLSRAAGR
ncbi:MAG: cobalamin B12-binding [Thermoleophilia bacterium]|nr:cobalamin B12-binding [Thermoleophilia bacterium]